MNLPRRSVGNRTNTKTSADPNMHDATGPSPSRINQSKWLEIQEEECVNHIINSIREEIVQSAMNTAYKNYLDNNSYAFVVHCAHQAWLELFNMMHLKCDPGENSATIAERWTGDEEYPPVPRDNWICGNVAIRKTSDIPSKPKECDANCIQEDSPCTLPKVKLKSSKYSGN